MAVNFDLRLNFRQSNLLRILTIETIETDRACFQKEEASANVGITN